MSKPIFREDWENKDASPLADSQVADFPFEQVYRDLDGEPEPKDSTHSRAGEMLREVFLWVLDVPHQAGADEAIGVRVLAVAGVCNPELLRSVTPAQIGVSHATLGRLTLEAAEMLRTLKAVSPEPKQ